MDSSISLSFELILLLGWLQKHEKPVLDAVVKQALKNGFLQYLEQTQNNDIQKQRSDSLYAAILEFLLHLETALAKNLNTIYLDEATTNALSPALKKIDFGNMNLKSVWLSMQQAKEKLANKNSQIAHEQDEFASEQASAVLFEKLLKNWKPTKKEPLN